jgi:hypothetical protein
VTLSDADVPTEAEVLISGVQRIGDVLPDLSGFTCGGPATKPRGRDNDYAYVEVKNDGASDASLAVSVAQGGLTAVDLIVYRSGTPPTNSLDARNCLGAAEGLEGPPSISPSGSSAVVIPAHRSVYILVASGSQLGPVSLVLSKHEMPSSDG